MRLLPLLLASLLLAGCATAPQTASTAAPASAPAASLLHTPLRYAGTTVLSACASAMGRAQCATPPPPAQPGSGGFRVLDYRGGGQALRANLTWTATVPALASLRVVLMHKANGVFTSRSAPTATGPSPLALDFRLNGTADQWALAVYEAEGRSAAGAGAAAYLPQPFHIEGDVVSA